jgi:hypothetical protein
MASRRLDVAPQAVIAVFPHFESTARRHDVFWVCVLENVDYIDFITE